jgi:hypothetical protein
MVGTKKALSYAVNHVTVTKRNTLLKERLSSDRDITFDEHKVLSYYDAMETKAAEQNREQNLLVAEEINYGAED